MSELVREIVDVNAFIGGDEEHPLLTVEAEGLTPTAGWANVRLRQGRLVPSFGYVTGAPEDGGFSAALDEELQRMHQFLARDAQV